MRTGRPKVMLTISSDERTALVGITRSRSLPAALTLRAKIVLACEREPSNAVVATRLGVGPHTIGKWRHRFVADRIEGLYDEMRTGRPRTVEDEAVAELITKTLARKPKAATHWTVRAIAKEVIEGEPARLIETLAGRIARKALQEPRVAAVSVTVTKRPASMRPIGGAAVVMRRARR